MNRNLATLGALHLAGNALILWLGYAWLGMGESNTLGLLFSAFVILFFACSAAWLHGLAMIHFDGSAGSSLRRASRIALRHIPPLLVLVFIACVVYALLGWVYGSLGGLAFTIGSYLTMLFRKPVAPQKILAIFHALIWILRWLVVPALLVPAVAHVAVRGWPGFRISQQSKRARYWLQMFLLLLAAVWFPIKLLAWIPGMPNFAAEMASFLIRLAVAYLLFAGLLLVLEWRTAGGRPVVTQPSTSSTP
jgi:hypothetical protein